MRCWNGCARIASASPSWTSSCTPWLLWRWPLSSTQPSCSSALSQRLRHPSSTPSSREWARSEHGESRKEALKHVESYSTIMDGVRPEREHLSRKSSLKWLSSHTRINVHQSIIKSSKLDADTNDCAWWTRIHMSQANKDPLLLKYLLKQLDTLDTSIFMSILILIITSI